MSEWLDRFFAATDWVGVVDPARELSVANDPAHVPRLLAALHDPLEARRWGAVYALGFSRRDGRVVRPLIRALRDSGETPRVRGQAAECLGYLGKRKAIKPLIQGSADESPEVRFWCVFALGQYRWRRDKVPIALVRALEARLDDVVYPGGRANWWPVGLEALAMLADRVPRHPAARRFRESILRVLNNPIEHRDEWRWATGYWEFCGLHRDPAIRLLFDAAVESVRNAGFDPLTFGRANSRP